MSPADKRRFRKLLEEPRSFDSLPIRTRLSDEDMAAVDMLIESLNEDGYLADMPLVMDYLRRACKRYRELGPLLKLLNRIDPEDTRVGYTF